MSLAKQVSRSGLTFIFLGLISAIVEQILYGDMNKEGFIREGFFMPLAYLFISFGVALILSTMVGPLFKRLFPIKK